MPASADFELSTILTEEFTAYLSLIWIIDDIF